MNENQRKWLLDLQEKGVKFEICSACDSGRWIRKGIWDFIFDSSFYRIPAQPIPDIPDWRKLCREMQGKGVKFEKQCDKWVPDECNFVLPRREYRIHEQPLPEWREEQSSAPQEKPEIPHREQQIRWHKDKLHSLETGEDMREWEFKDQGGEWEGLRPNLMPGWIAEYEYRRKPKVRKYEFYWCVIGNGNNEWVTWRPDEQWLKDQLAEIGDEISKCKQLTPIKKETVEIEETE